MLFENYLPEIKDSIAFSEYVNFIDSNKIIDKLPDKYYEAHHIVPRCYLPKELHKEKDNIALLEGKNHLRAHVLLAEALRDNKSCFTVWQMIHRSENQGSVNDLSEEEFTRLKIDHKQCAALIMSKTMKGRPSVNKGKQLSEEHKRKISKSQLGRKFSENHIKNLSESHKGYRMPESQKQKISQSNLGKEKTIEWRKHLSESNKNKIHGIPGGVHIYYLCDDIYRTIVTRLDLPKYLNQGWCIGRPGIKTCFSSGVSGANKGRIWINNTTQNKVIDSYRLNEYLEDGWKKGRLTKI